MWESLFKNGHWRLKMSAFCPGTQADLSPQQTTEQMNLNDVCGVYKSHITGWSADPRIPVLFSIFNQESIMTFASIKASPHFASLSFNGSLYGLSSHWAVFHFAQFTEHRKVIKEYTRQLSIGSKLVALSCYFSKLGQEKGHEDGDISSIFASGIRLVISICTVSIS